ncbi:MAG: hypothetical protein KME30_27310 [Iphinoe sp. HA4291-MV1]|jgi:hypothetical protein|nr:hypothetical protein [Iphinoe sp. HA4291-MV1]
MRRTNGKVQAGESSPEGELSHLDKLLEDKPAEFQTKVLRFAIDAGMKPDDPAFRLVQYIGYLAQLTESAPLEWKELFQRLQGELNEWTQLTAEQLEEAAEQSETINNLAQSCNRLSTALNALDLTSQQQLEQLKVLSEVSPFLKGIISEIPTLKKLLVNFNQALSQNQMLRVELSFAQMEELKREILTVSRNRELGLIKGEMEELAQNQRWLMQKMEMLVLKESERTNSLGMFAGVWQRLEEAVSFLFYSVDLWSGLVGGMVCFVVVCVFLAIVTRVTFQFAPAPLPYFVQQQIQYTTEQVGYANVKLQRVEKKLGTDPNQKKNRN